MPELVHTDSVEHEGCKSCACWRLRFRERPFSCSSCQKKHKLLLVLSGQTGCIANGNRNHYIVVTSIFFWRERQYCWRAASGEFRWSYATCKNHIHKLRLRSSRTLPLLLPDSCGCFQLLLRGGDLFFFEPSMTVDVFCASATPFSISTSRGPICDTGHLPTTRLFAHAGDQRDHNGRIESRTTHGHKACFAVHGVVQAIPLVALIGDAVLEMEGAGGRMNGVVGRHWHVIALLVAVVFVL